MPKKEKPKTVKNEQKSERTTNSRAAVAAVAAVAAAAAAAATKAESTSWQRRIYGGCIFSVCLFNKMYRNTRTKTRQNDFLLLFCGVLGVLFGLYCY